MELNQLHFAHPLWLFAGLAIPLLWIFYHLFYYRKVSSNYLEKFIDKHLLSYLLLDNSSQNKRFWKPLLLWSVVWLSLTFALAGPRWNFREIEVFSKNQSLVILLDLSESMNTNDVKPSRLGYAKQKIEDIVNQAKGVKIGLVAFAADPHMITPLTDDLETIRHLLPSLDTDLVYIQGSRLTSAFEMASMMLAAEPGQNKAIFMLTDGGFEDSSALLMAKKLAKKGIVIHAMGIGTTVGAPIKNRKGDTIKKDGVTILSKLEKDRITEISKIGNGFYLEAQSPRQDVNLIIKALEDRAEAQIAIGEKNKLWDERFYLLLLPSLPIFLWWFRRGCIFILIGGLFLSSELSASISNCFKNSEQMGQDALDAAQYEEAAQIFQDPYRKGVSCYKAGNFAEAEKLFQQSSRTEVAASASYNLGNALAQQQKFQEAIAAYENTLKEWPEHTKAKENLELIKKILKEKQKDSQDDKNSDQKDKQNKNQGNSDKNQNKSNNDQNDNDKEQSENSKDSNSSNDPSQQNNSSENYSDSQENNQSTTTQEQEEKKKSESNPKTENKEQHEKEPELKLDGQGAHKKDVATSQMQDSQDESSQKNQTEQDADLWLNQIASDPKVFMKNKFYIESKKNGVTEGVDPW